MQSSQDEEGAQISAKGDRSVARKRWSLQLWLMVTVTSIVALILVGSAVGTGAIFSGILQANLDSTLRDEADRLRLINPSRPFAQRVAADVLDENSQQPGFLLILASPYGGISGAVVGSDGEAQELTSSQLSRLLEQVTEHGFSTVDVPDRGAYRVAPLSVNGNSVGVAGVSLAELSTTIQSIVVTVTTVTVIGLVLLAIAVAAVVRVGLRPLRMVGDTATRVAAMPLIDGPVRITDRVPAELAAQPTEVGKVAAALNTLLDHVDVSLEQRQRNEDRMRRFVADASHELRTPLASIRGYSELTLRDSTLSPISQETIERVHSQSVRMTRLVEDLLLLARLDEGIELAPRPVDLSQLVAEAVQNTRVIADDHVWLLQLAEDPVTVNGDADRLHQVVNNLLANARIHTPAGTTVTTTLRKEHDRVIVHIQDDGPGIDESVREELFERFTRSDASRTRATGGTGLGLSISRAIIAAHGGTLSVESSPGNTQFEIALPVDPEPQPD